MKTLSGVAAVVGVCAFLISPSVQAFECPEIPCGRNDQKLAVCHFPPDNPENAQQLCVSEKAAERHFNQHDDCISVCECCLTDQCEVDDDCDTICGIGLGTCNDGLCFCLK